VRSTKWGELHEFGPVAPLRESKFVRRPENAAVLNGSAVVELLIGADGKVLDAAVAESSGDPNVDAAARTAFAGDRFPRIPGYTSSAPYVARHRVVFKGISGLAMKELIGWPTVQ
jgi:TonB family protein